MPIQEHIVSRQSSWALEPYSARLRPSISAFRVVLSMAIVGLTLLLVVYLADWSQLKLALRQLGSRPWLVGIFVLAYTGAFLFRAFAWRVLLTHRIGLFQLFVSIQAGMLANHIVPVKLGEFVRPLLAARFGVPMAQAAGTTAVARYLDFAALLAIAAVVGTALSLTSGAQLWLEGLALPAGVILGCGAAPDHPPPVAVVRLASGPPCAPGLTYSGTSSGRCLPARLPTPHCGRCLAGPWRPPWSWLQRRPLGLSSQSLRQSRLPPSPSCSSCST